MNRYSFYLIICLLNPSCIKAQDSFLISRKSAADFRSIRTISNSIVRANDEPISKRRLNREDLTGLTSERSSTNLITMSGQQKEAINQKLRLKCVKTENGFTVIDLATNKSIKERAVEGNFDMQWEEDSETMRIITGTTLFRFRLAHDRLLRQLNSDQLGFLKYCSSIWEKGELVTIQGPKRHRAYTALPEELRAPSLFTVIPSLHESQLPKSLLASTVSCILSLLGCRS